MAQSTFTEMSLNRQMIGELFVLLLLTLLNKMLSMKVNLLHLPFLVLA